MARTKQTFRTPTKPKKKEKSVPLPLVRQFEPVMRKYYPKTSRFFSHYSHHQPSDANNYHNGRDLQRYKRSFFRSFCANSGAQTAQLSQIPNNLRHLSIFEGSQIVLRKLIKQNKRLEHIVLAIEDEELNQEVAKYLKYSKSLRSVTFKDRLPYFSDTMCQKMLKTWGNTLEAFSILGAAHMKYSMKGEYFRRAMETILKFPKLKKLELKSSQIDFGKYFPFEKLQERNIAYEIGLETRQTTFKSLKKNSPQFEPTGLAVIKLFENDKMLGYQKFKEYSKQVLFLYPQDRKRFEFHLLPVFQKILALDLAIYGTNLDLSSIGQLNSLKHLAIHFVSHGDTDDLFKYLNKNVAPYQKLETFMISCSGQEDQNQKSKKELSRKAIVKFFEACSESLRTVHFGFHYPTEKSVDLEYFYEGLSKLKNLQSLTLILGFQTFNSTKKVEEICEIVSKIKSLEELTFRIRKEKYQEKSFNLKFPLQLKKLCLGMKTPSVLFDASKTLWSLPNLTNLELEFKSFKSQKWKNLIQSTLEKLKELKTFKITDENGSRDVKKS